MQMSSKGRPFQAGRLFSLNQLSHLFLRAVAAWIFFFPFSVLNLKLFKACIQRQVVELAVPGGARLWEGEGQALMGRSARPNPLPLPLILGWLVLQSEETTTFSCFIHFIHTFLQL